MGKMHELLNRFNLLLEASEANVDDGHLILNKDLNKLTAHYCVKILTSS